MNKIIELLLFKKQNAKYKSNCQNVNSFLSRYFDFNFMWKLFVTIVLKLIFQNLIIFSKLKYSNISKLFLLYILLIHIKIINILLCYINQNVAINDSNYTYYSNSKSWCIDNTSNLMHYWTFWMHSLKVFVVVVSSNECSLINVWISSAGRSRQYLSSRAHSSETPC